MRTSSTSLTSALRARYARRAAIVAVVAATALLAAACPGGGDPPATEPEPTPPDMMTMMPEPTDPEPQTPTVNAALSASTVDEGASVMLVLSASAALQQDAQFKLAATAGVTFGDAMEAEATLTIAQGQTRASIAVNAPLIDADSVESLESAITVTAQDGADVDLADATLSLTVANLPPPTVTASVSMREVLEGADTTLMLTASAPLAQDTIFNLTATDGISFDNGIRALQIAAGGRTASVGITADQITNPSSPGQEVTIRISTDSTAVTLSDNAVSFQVVNGIDVLLEEPELTADGATLRVTASRAAETDITVVISVPEDIFGVATATLTIPAGQTTGELVLEASEMLENMAELSFTISRVSGSAIAAALEGRETQEVVFEGESTASPPPGGGATTGGGSTGGGSSGGSTGTGGDDDDDDNTSGSDCTSNCVTLTLEDDAVNELARVAFTLEISPPFEQDRVLVIRSAEGVNQFVSVQAGAAAVSGMTRTPSVLENTASTISVFGAPSGYGAMAADVMIRNSASAVPNLARAFLSSTRAAGGSAVTLTLNLEEAAGVDAQLEVQDSRGILTSGGRPAPAFTIASGDLSGSVELPLPLTADDLLTHLTILDDQGRTLFETGMGGAFLVGDLDLTVASNRLAVTAAPAAVAEGSPTTLTLTLSRPVAETATVTLADDQNLLAHVPAAQRTAVFPPRTTQASITFTAPRVTADSAVQFTADPAAHNCCSVDLQPLSVTNSADEPAVTAALAQSALTEGDMLALTLLIEETHTQDIEVQVSVSDVAGMQIRRAATIPAGETGTTENFTVAPDNVYGNQSGSVVLELDDPSCCRLDTRALDYTVADTHIITIRLPEGPLYENAVVPITFARNPSPNTVVATIFDADFNVFRLANGDVAFTNIQANAPASTVNVRLPFVDGDAAVTLRLEDQATQLACENPKLTQTSNTCAVAGDTVLQIANRDITADLSAPAAVGGGDTLTGVTLTLGEPLNQSAMLTLQDSAGLLDSMPTAMLAATATTVTFPAVRVDLTEQNAPTTLTVTGLPDHCCTAPAADTTVSANDVLISVALSRDPAPEGEMVTATVELSRALDRAVTITLNDSLSLLTGERSVTIPAGGVEASTLISLPRVATPSVTTVLSAQPSVRGCCAIDPSAASLTIMSTAGEDIVITPALVSNRILEEDMLMLTLTPNASVPMGNAARIIITADEPISQVSQSSGSTSNVDPFEAQLRAPNLQAGESETVMITFPQSQTQFLRGHRSGRLYLTLDDDCCRLTRYTFEYTRLDSHAVVVSLPGNPFLEGSSGDLVYSGLPGVPDGHLTFESGIHDWTDSLDRFGTLSEDATAPPAETITFNLRYVANDVTTRIELADHIGESCGNQSDGSNAQDFNCVLEGDLDLTILNSDIQVTLPSITVNEGETAALTLTLDRPLRDDTVITIRDSQALLNDATGEYPSATINQGETTVDFTLHAPQVAADTDIRLFPAGLPSNCCAVTGERILTIRNNDAQVTLPSITVNEGETATLRVTLNRALGQDVALTLRDDLELLADANGEFPVATLDAGEMAVEFALPVAPYVAADAASALTLVGFPHHCCAITGDRTLNVMNNDIPVTLTLGRNPIQEFETTTLSVMLGSPLPNDATLRILHSGLVEDSSTIALTAGETTAAFTLQAPFVAADAAIQFTLGEGLPPNCCAIAGDTTLNVQNSDIPVTLRLGSTSIREGETTTLSVVLGRATSQPLNLRILQSGLVEDSSTVALTPGQQDAQIVLAAPIVAATATIQIVVEGLPPNCCAVMGETTFTLTVEDSNHITPTLLLPFGTAASTVARVSLPAVATEDVEFTLTDAQGMLGTRTVTVPAGQRSSAEFNLDLSTLSPGDTIMLMLTAPLCCAPTTVPLTLGTVVQVSQSITLPVFLSDASPGTRQIGPNDEIEHQTTNAHTTVTYIVRGNLAAGTVHRFNVAVHDFGGAVPSLANITQLQFTNSQGGVSVIEVRKANGSLLGLRRSQTGSITNIDIRAAGTHTLEVRGENASTTGDYEFRIVFIPVA